MFEWSKFFALAEELGARATDEAALRSAVSRAYYAVFGTARERLRNEGVAEEVLQSHWKVWRDYRRAPGRRALGIDGDRLKAKRVRADYANTIGFLPALVRDSMEMARALLISWDSLPRR